MGCWWVGVGVVGAVGVVGGVVGGIVVGVVVGVVFGVVVGVVVVLLLCWCCVVVVRC